MDCCKSVEFAAEGWMLLPAVVRVLRMPVQRDKICLTCVAIVCFRVDNVKEGLT